MPEGTVRDDGSGNLTIPTTIIMNPLSGSWIRVAAGTYALGSWGSLWALIPPTGSRGATVAPTVLAWTDGDVNYSGRDRVLLAQRQGGGPIYTRFGVRADSSLQPRLNFYLTSATFRGNHNCDDVPTNCCAAGYHMCAGSDLGGNERSATLETAGTGRDAAPRDKFGWKQVGGTTVCTDWEREGSGDHGARTQARSQDGRIADWESNAATCNNSLPVWCCRYNY